MLSGSASDGATAVRDLEDETDRDWPYDDGRSSLPYMSEHAEKRTREDLDLKRLKGNLADKSAYQGSCGATPSAATVATPSSYVPSPSVDSSAKPSRWLVGNLSEDESGMSGATPSAATAATLPSGEASEEIEAEKKKQTTRGGGGKQ